MGLLGRRACSWVLGLAAALWLAGAVQAQPRFSSIPTLNPQPPPVEELTPPEFTSAVSMIDNVFPRSQARMRADANYHSTRPQRAEYIWAKAGPPLPETNLSYQELSSYIEYALGPWFSVFLETPTRWMNPEVNQNVHGYGDTNLGFRFLTFAGEQVQATFQLRAYAPTGRGQELGTQHWSLEPALLGHFQILDFLQLEGEFRYWAPLGGSDFAGDLLRYGVGLSYGQRSPSHIWVMPVVEAVGWTVLSGKEFVSHTPNPFGIESAAGDTIVNVQAGVRWGFGERCDIYTGYGRGVTGDKWFRDYLRLELRILF